MALAALVVPLSVSLRVGADSTAAPCLQPACSLPDFAAEHCTWGERAEGCHHPSRRAWTWQHRISPRLLDAGLLRDVRHGHLVPRASVSPPGGHRALGAGAGAGQTCRDVG